MANKEAISRIDKDKKLHKRLLEFCRLKPGEIWTDPVNGHKVGVLDATNTNHLQKLFGTEKANLMINAGL